MKLMKKQEIYITLLKYDNYNRMKKAGQEYIQLMKLGIPENHVFMFSSTLPLIPENNKNKGQSESLIFLQIRALCKRGF
jgi:hypothetical protein